MSEGSNCCYRTNYLGRNRRDARDKAEEFMRQGNGMMAQRKFSEAVDITPEMAFDFI